MEHALPGAGADVKHCPIAILNPALPRKLRGNYVAIAHIGGVVRTCFLQAANMSLRYDQNMGRRLRVNVLEGEGAVVLVNFLGRRLTFYDSAEKTARIVIGHETSFQFLVPSFKSDHVLADE
jgi:hypothetical protein